MFYLILLVCLTFFSYFCIFETINHVYGQQLSHIHKTTTKNPFILKKLSFHLLFFTLPSCSSIRLSLHSQTTINPCLVDFFLFLKQKENYDSIININSLILSYQLNFIWFINEQKIVLRFLRELYFNNFMELVLKTSE